MLLGQGVFFNLYAAAYFIAPRTCHAFVGYLEEEAVKTYTKCIQDIDNGVIADWQTQPAPRVAIKYWQLPENATMRDVILAVRADEAIHRDVNHTFSVLPDNVPNPFV